MSDDLWRNSSRIAQGLPPLTSQQWAAHDANRNGGGENHGSDRRNGHHRPADPPPDPDPGHDRFVDNPPQPTHVRPSGLIVPGRSDEGTYETNQAGGADDGDPWRPVDLRQFLDGTHRPVVPTMLTRTDGQALIYPGLVHSLHGESESGKSMVAQHLGVQLINLGHHVLYLDFESDAGSVVGRFLALGADRRRLAQHLHYLRPEGPARGPGWDALLGRRFTLGVIDGVTEALASAGARSSMDNDDVTRWHREVTKMIADRTGAAVIVVDHVARDAETRGRFALGAQAKISVLTGAGFTVEVLAPLGRGLVGTVHLRVGKDRPGFVRPVCGDYRKADRTQLAAVVTIDGRDPDNLRVMVDPPGSTISVTGAVATFRPTTLMERICDALHARHQGAPDASTRDIRGMVAGSTKNKDRALDLLVAEGYVRRHTDGTATRHHLLRRYVAAEDPASDTFRGSQC